jgi:hypothetical protein
MDNNEIIEKVRNSLKKCSFDNDINWRTVRIKISKSKSILGGVQLHLMSGANVVSELTLSKTLELSTMESMIVSKFISNKLQQLSETMDIDKSCINGRIYTKKEDFTPQLYIFNDKTPVKEIGINELIN